MQTHTHSLDTMVTFVLTYVPIKMVQMQDVSQSTFENWFEMFGAHTMKGKGLNSYAIENW